MLISLVEISMSQKVRILYDFASFSPFLSRFAKALRTSSKVGCSLKRIETTAPVATLVHSILVLAPPRSLMTR